MSRAVLLSLSSLLALVLGTRREARDYNYRYYNH